MYRHILIATDGSELADRAVVHGSALAKSVGSKATIVTVTETWSPFEMVDDIQSGVQDPIGEFEALASKYAARILANAKAKAAQSGVDPETLHIKDHPPAEGIVEAAQNRNCDLIVMSSHGRSGMQLALLGSQTTKVLASSKVPVLVVR